MSSIESQESQLGTGWVDQPGVEFDPAVPLVVEFAADPVVIELGGRRRTKAELHLDVFGVATGQDLEVEVEKIPDADGFQFEPVGEPVQRRAHGASGPIRVTVSIRCAVREGADDLEGRSVLTVRLRGGVSGEDALGDGVSSPAVSFSVSLIASAQRVLPLWQVLREEYMEIVRDEAWREVVREDPVLGDPGADEGVKLSRLFSLVSDLEPGLAGLCFSGGGIRSAVFNLGVMQGLVDAGALGRFDYLSSVSGGGYISSWLAGWVHRAPGLGRVTPFLEAPEGGRGVDAEEPEAYPIRFLRRYSNYLTPRLGILSADTWTLVAIVVRNLILNWLVLLPVLAAALAVPLLFIAEGWSLAGEFVPWLYGGGLLAGAVGVFFMGALRASADSKAADGRSSWDQWFLRFALFPLLLAVVLLAWASALWVGQVERSFLQALPWTALWAVAVPALALLLGAPVQRRLQRPRPSMRGDLVSLVLAGTVIAVLDAAILAFWAKPLLASRYLLYPLLAPALLLGTMLLGKSLFVAFASCAEERGYSSELGDADREWWARWSGWILISIVVWIVWAALAFYAPAILDSTVKRVVALAGAGGLGTMVSHLGKSAASSRWKNVALALAAPLFCLFLLLLVAAGSQGLLATVLPSTGARLGWVAPYRGGLGQVALGIVSFLALGLLLGRFVNVNRFSLQAMYRNRLVRAFLGASNSRRRANLFTGFDPGDNLRLHRLRGNRPWPLINMALNLVGGAELAWQERKAESFTATPLHCGSASLGYRRSQIYGGEEGISIGTAVATSGAAASPNMGYHSSPAIAFIMALFNARLGAWLGNPGPAGARTFTRGGPRQAAALLLAEALGRTNERGPYVYLSDGGHFENLGLYEIVRRRCRVVVVCDAGCDPACEFDDLGNAIRKVRTDLGIPIEFGKRIRVYPKAKDRPRADASYCSVGTIRYSAVDGTGAEKDGFLLYIKPSIIDREPYDVVNYARRSEAFPHESTTDQWFSESQFESYRALGKTVIDTILGDASRMGRKARSHLGAAGPGVEIGDAGSPTS